MKSGALLAIAALLAPAWAGAFCGCAESAPPVYTPAAEWIGDAPYAATPEPQDVEIGLPADTYADTDPSALTDFRAALDPHGQWSDDATYGTLWTPDEAEVGADFVPYVSAGSWAWDGEYEWLGEPAWSWVAFHYGRWVLVHRRWSWVPGRAYAGAWVTWRTSGDAIGWAPLPPRFIWRGGVAVTLIGAPSVPFVYTRHEDLFARPLARRVLVGEDAATAARASSAFVPSRPVPAIDPFAYPAPRGPDPSSLHLDASRVRRPPPADAPLARARQLAHPSSAERAGAHAPSVHVVHVTPPLPMRAPRIGGGPRR